MPKDKVFNRDELGIINLENLSEDTRKEIRKAIEEKSEGHNERFVLTMPTKPKSRLRGFTKASKEMLRKIHDRFDSKRTPVEHDFTNGMNKVAQMLQYYINSKSMRDNKPFRPDMVEMAKRAEVIAGQLRHAVELQEKEEE